MKQTNYFEMDILAVFHFRDGRNVFTGLIKEGTSLKDGAKVTIFVDGEPREIVQVNTMFTTPPPPDGRQSLSTYDHVSLTMEFVEKHNCKLIEVKN